MAHIPAAVNKQDAGAHRRMQARRPRLRIFFGAALLLAIMGVFAGTMVGFDHNEHMYITASVLLAQGQAMYADFAYLQMPYLPILYSTLYSLFGVSGYYLLLGKLVSFLLFLLSALGIYGITRDVLEDTTLAVGLTALFCLHNAIMDTAYEASNYILPTFLLICGFYLFYQAIREPVRMLWVGAAGLCIALAVGTKLYYLVSIPAFALIALWYPRSLSFRQRIVRVVVPLGAGMAVGIMPAFIYLLLYGDIFMFNNMGYHSTNALWWAHSYGAPNVLALKLQAAVMIIFHPHNSSILVIIALLAHRLWQQRRTPGTGNTLPPVELPLSGLLLLFFTVIAFTPTPLQPQYFAAPIPFLFIFLAVLLRRARTGISSIWQDRGAFALVAISLAISAPPIVSNSLAASTIGNWAGISYHRTAHEVRRILETQTSIAPHHTNVATLSPLYALEANLPIYEELATGAFLYRVGDLLTAEERLRYVGTSPDTIHALLDRDPPAAILVGYYTNHPLEYLEQPLVEYARTRNYRAIVADVFPENIVLYVRSAP